MTMSAPRVLRARYADWRPVKGRKVLQIVLEIPLEEQGEALTMLGAPLPDRDLWVAIARLDEKAQEARPATLAQRAGILCNEGAFQRFIGASTAEEAATRLREKCAIESRRHLDTNAAAGRFFLDLVANYQNWMRGLAA